MSAWMAEKGQLDERSEILNTTNKQTNKQTQYGDNRVEILSSFRDPRENSALVEVYRGHRVNKGRTENQGLRACQENPDFPVT